MSLVRCPACGATVSGQAPSCPHCGHPFRVVAPAKQKKGFFDGCGLFGCAGLIVLGLFGTCAIVISASDDDDGRASTAAASGSAAASGAAVAPEVPKVALRTLLSEYRDNEVRADDQYKDKIVQTSGTVMAVQKGILGDPYVLISGGVPGREAQCMVADDSAGAVAGLSKGRRVTVRARVAGLTLVNVMLRDCEIVR